MAGDPRPKAPTRASKGRRRLPPMSPKRRRALTVRAEVVAAVTARDRTCRGPGMGAPGPCWGPLDAHEPRGGSERHLTWLDADQAILLCRGHHSFVHAHPAESYRLGLLIRSSPLTRPPTFPGDTP